MAQEIQLIDTIFYFVDTMDEYRLVLENNKILSRVIVFVDETQEIYKDGKLFGGYLKSVEKIEELAEEVRQAMDLSENDMRQLISEIRQQVWDNFTDEVELITKNLEDYADLLDKLKKEFAEGEIEEGLVIQTVDLLKGQIKDYVSWKSSIQQEFIQMSRTMDAHNGILRTFAQRLDTQNDKVTNYEHLLDLKELSLKEYIESYDITNKVRSILGREMLLQEGLLHDYATITDVDNLTRQSVDTYMNSQDPSWTEVTSWASAGYDAAGKLRPIELAVAGFNSKIEGLEAQASMFSNWYTENADALAYLKTFANDHSSGFDLTAAFNDRNTLEQVTAKIFAYANSNESTIVFEADKFRMNGQAFTINVNQVRGIGDWILENVTMDRFKAVDGAGRSISINALPTSQTDGVYGIKSSTGGFYFSMDGSGWVANENIKWDAQGNLTIKGNVDGPNSMTKIENVYISNYWSKTEFPATMYNRVVKLGDLDDIGNNGLKSWITQQITNASLGNGQAAVIEQQVQTSLQNEISKADGLFQGFTRNSNLSNILDGYVTNQGLGTTISAALFDQNGNPINNGTVLYSSLSNLKTLSGALINPNTGLVDGIITSETLSSAVENALTGIESYSALTTWALDVQDMPSAGWSLSALVHKLSPNVPENTVNAYIEAVVNEKTSTITISANLINLEGTTFALDIVGSTLATGNGILGVKIDSELLSVHLTSHLTSHNSSGGNWAPALTENYATLSYDNITIHSGTAGLSQYNTIYGMNSISVESTSGLNNSYGEFAINVSRVAISGTISCSDFECYGDITTTGSITMGDIELVSSETNVATITYDPFDHIFAFSEKINAPRIVCGNSGLWVQGDSQFDGVCTFNDECDFNNTAQFSQDVDFGSSSNISVGGISTVTQTVSISGKTLTFRKGMLVGITG